MEVVVLYYCTAFKHLTDVVLQLLLFTTTTGTTTILWRLYKTTCVSWHPVENWRNFVGAKFYCLYVLADGS